MIKAIGKIDGKTTIMVGLSEENCRRLLDGEPIRFNVKEMIDAIPDEKDKTIEEAIILGGKDTMSILDDLAKLGKMPPEEEWRICSDIRQ